MSSPSTAPLPAHELPSTLMEPERFTLHAWTRARRAVALAARLVMLGNFLYFTGWLLWDIVEGAQTLTPEPLALGLVAGGVVPFVLVAVLRSRSRATLEVGDTALTLTLRDGARLEIPLDAVESVRPWRLPLPGPGLSLRMNSGRALAQGLEVEDATPLLESLGRRDADLGAARSHPLVRYARARQEWWLKRWYHMVFKLVVFPILPAGIFFRADQIISFGGWLGAYKAFGLLAYLRSFGRYYVPIALCLLLIACFLRGVAEAVSFTAAWLTPSWTRDVRRGAERIGRFFYYAGILAFVATRFLL